jgi:hypothetical protein
VVRWRRIDLKQHIEAVFGVAMHERSVAKQLRALGLRRLVPRPQYPKADLDVQEGFKNVRPAPSARGFVKLARDRSAQTYPVSSAALPARMELRTSRAS